MSHQQGDVLIDGKIVGYFEYDGTSDFARQRVFRTQEELCENWRKDQGSKCCHSEDHSNIIDVTLHAHYGNGLLWNSRICTDCLWIVGYRNSMEEITEQWEKEMNLCQMR